MEALVRSGHTVAAVIPDCPAEAKVEFIESGCTLIHVNMNRRGINPLEDMGLFLRYIKILKREKPDFVFNYTIKPNIYCGIACEMLRIAYCLNVTGLGSVYERSGAIQVLVDALYRLACMRARQVFFENTTNRLLFIEKRILRENQATALPGAGVNTEKYQPTPYPPDTGVTNILYIGRIMHEKGIDELLAVIRRIHVQRKDVHFHIIGWYEEAYRETLERFVRDGLLSFHGFQKEIKPFVAAAHAVILPSWHEGMSNALLEAAAMARPLLASDIPGCREALKPGESGMLFRVRDAESLYQCVICFMDLSYEQKNAMGIASRMFVENTFDKRLVINKTLGSCGLLNREIIKAVA
ncbi:galacturonosyl transferase [Clostridia bacterium]|nr:galacturonosyl transferase [Clostridia bacterium]